MAVLGDKLETRVEIDGVPMDVTDERLPNETTAAFMDRHLAHVRAFLREHGVE